MMKHQNKQNEMDQGLNQSQKSILARGCDPRLSSLAARFIPPQIGNPVYVPTTDDVDFIQQLRTKKWSIVYFARVPVGSALQE